VEKLTLPVSTRAINEASTAGFRGKEMDKLRSLRKILPVPATSSLPLYKQE
jgi:hypothetical protein